MTKEQIERAKTKSLSKNRITLTKEKFKRIIMGTFLTGAITTILLSIPISIGINNNSEIKEENDLIKDNIDYAINLINRNTYRIKGSDGFFYDEISIAKELLENPMELDTNIYAVFTKIGYNKNNKLEEMNKIMSIMNEINKDENIKTYSSFSEYADRKKILDENGEIKEEEFKKYASELAKANDVLDISSYRGAK